MRVLLTADAVGGVWRYAVDLARALPERGVTPVLAVLGPAPGPAQRREVDGIELVATGLPLDWTATARAEVDGAAERLRALAALTGCTSAHLHAPALVGRARWSIPCVATAHSCVGTWWRAMRAGPPPPDLAWRIAATRDGLAAADSVLAPTRSHAHATEAAYGVAGIRPLHNGAAWPAPVAAGRERAVLTAGRLWDEAKDAAALSRVAPGLGLPVRAAGPVAAPGGEAVRLPGIALLGVLDRAGMARAYAEAAVFCSMARYEPFGLAVLEAAQHGCTLVLRDTPGFRELWDGAAYFTDDAGLAATLRRAADAPIDARDRARRYALDPLADAVAALHRQEVRACA
jgi:glycosyltransferase involved in cell wall biosynthesis